jgi:hypothetical protein
MRLPSYKFFPYHRVGYRTLRTITRLSLLRLVPNKFLGYCHDGLQNTHLAETPDAAIYPIVAGGIPGTLMPAWGNRLSDQDIQSLVAFLRSLEPSAPAIVPPILTP